MIILINIAKSLYNMQNSWWKTIGNLRIGWSVLNLIIDKKIFAKMIFNDDLIKFLVYRNKIWWQSTTTNFI